MTDGLKDLQALHEVPYSNIEGAYVKVKQEVNTNPVEISRNPETHTEEREGVIVGRGNGRGVAYDTGEKRVMETSIGPSIYLETPEETILEVRTDSLDNELLEFEPENDDE